jgi:hypothetical protein
LFGVAAAWTSRTSSCWCCVTSPRFRAAGLSGRSSKRRIGRCLRPRPGTCRAPRAACFWLRHGRCCAGSERSCGGSGDGLLRGADGRRCRPRCGSWCCGSRARTLAGAIAGSAPSWPSSASTSLRRASVGCSLERGWSRRRGVAARVGASSTCASGGRRRVRLLQCATKQREKGGGSKSVSPCRLGCWPPG